MKSSVGSDKANQGPLSGKRSSIMQCKVVLEVFVVFVVVSTALLVLLN